MKKGKKFKSIFMVILLSFVVVFLIPVFTNLVFYTNTYNTLKEYLYKYNSTVLNQVENKINEEIVQPLETIKSLTNANPFYVDFVFPNDNISKTDMYLDYKTFSRELMTYFSNPFILEICVYVPVKDKIISANFFESPKLYYEYINKPINLSYSSWINFLNGSYNNVFVPSFKTIYNKKERSTLLFIHSLENWKFGDKNANLLIYLDEEKLKEYLKGLLLDQNGSIVIMDAKGKPVVQYSENYKDESLFLNATNKITKNIGFSNVEINHKNYIVYTTVSMTNGWKYYYFILSDKFLLNLKRIRVTLIIMIVFTIMIGGIIIYLLSIKNYKPIKDVKNLLLSYSVKDQSKAKTFSDEYSLIKELISKLIKEDTSLRKKLTKFEDVLKNIYVIQFLKGESDISNHLISYFKNKLSSKGKYAIVIIEIEEYFKRAQEKIDEDLTQLILFNILCEMFENENWVTYPIVLSKKEVGIILGANNDSNMSPDLIKTVLEKGKNFIESNFAIFFTSGISEIKEDLSYLPKCYKEAKEALKLKYAAERNKIYCYREVSDIVDANKYFYLPLEMENIIVNNITAGDIEATKQIMDKLFNDYFFSLSRQPYLQKLFLLQLITIYLKVMHVIGKRDDLNLSLLLEYLDEVEQGKINELKESLEKFKEQFIILANNINVSETSNKSGSNLISKIIKFIDENYCDPNLSLTYISEKFNISLKYLSSFFKEKVGMNLSDYIFQLRISKAKELLINTDASVNEICQMIGYTHVSSFIKAFKKTEGISPAKYRSIYQKS